MVVLHVIISIVLILIGIGTGRLTGNKLTVKIFMGLAAIPIILLIDCHNEKQEQQELRNSVASLLDEVEVYPWAKDPSRTLVDAKILLPDDSPAEMAVSKLIKDGGIPATIPSGETEWACVVKLQHHLFAIQVHVITKKSPKATYFIIPEIDSYGAYKAGTFRNDNLGLCLETVTKKKK